MTDTLTQLIAKVQAQLLDDGTRFSTPTCTAALRQALRDLNQSAPMYSGGFVAAIADQLEYEVTAFESRALSVNDVLSWDATTSEVDDSLPFDSYREAARLWFRLREARAVGELLAVRYSLPNTIYGLDGSVETSTLPNFYDQCLVDGACYHALYIRAVSRIEQINLNDGVAKTMMESALHFQQAFTLGLVSAGRLRAPVGEASTAAWNDRWNGWDV
jgi:hypothetical protein